MRPGAAMRCPPPTTAAVDDVWCGAQNGGRGTSPAPGGSDPISEWIAVTSRASSSLRSGSRPGRRSASMVLPTPGGPDRNTWWLPAAGDPHPPPAPLLPEHVGEVGLPRRLPVSRDGRIGLGQHVDLAAQPGAEL